MKLVLKFISVALILPCFGSFGQDGVDETLVLSFKAAIEMGAKENISVQAILEEESAALSELRNAESMKLPSFSTAIAYQKYTKVTLFEDFLGESHQITKPPNSNAASLGVDGNFIVYNGNLIKSKIEIASINKDIAGVNSNELVATVSLKVAEQYLDLVRLYHLKKLKNEQITRSRKRLGNILSLYENGKVTKSDLLRAELNLSQVILDSDAANNDYRISLSKLKVLLNIAESRDVLPSDTTSMGKMDSLEVNNILNSGAIPYALQRNGDLIRISEVQRKIVKSFSLPSVSLVGKYGFNYPNNLIFPPIAQSYAVGFIGAKVSYSISSIYQNKHALDAANFRVSERRLEKEYIERNIDEQKSSLYLKYLESLNRIEVNEKSIAQAESNYTIINTKYFNQLALLTDLLEADDIYQQTKYNLVTAHINTMVIYYRVLFITGQL